MSVDHSSFQSERNSIHQLCWSLLLLSMTPIILSNCNLHAQDAPQYRFQREIEIGDLQRDELVAFSVDTSVYASIQDSLHDLRLENAEGETVPFIVRKKRETERYDAEKTWSADDITLKPIKESGLEIRFELSDDDPVPDGVRILTPLTNFQQRINIFAIDKAGQETVLVKDEVIFDYSQFMDVRSVEVTLPETDARSFRIDIDTLTTRQRSQLTELTRKLTSGEETSKQLRTEIIERPFRIDRIELWAEYQRSRSKVLDTYSYDLVLFDSTVDSETNQTIINLKSNSEPLTQFEIITPDQNFQRVGRVYKVTSAGEKDHLQLIAETNFVRLNFRDIQKKELSIHFPRNRHSLYKLVIDNGDNPPLPVTRVQAAGEIDEVVFVAKKSMKYFLQYGNSNLNKAALDTATIRTLLEEDVQPIIVALNSDETILSEAINPPTNFMDLFNNPLLLGAIVLAMIAILSWLLYSAAQNVDQLPEDQSDQQRSDV